MEAPPFWQRVTAMADICGPAAWPSLFASTSEILAARDALAGPLQHSEAELARARYLVNAAVHPDTKEVIPWPFRMAAHVPANTVLLVAMLASKSPLATGAAQAANQTFNALQFWSNRNASNQVDAFRFGASFVASVVASVGLGVALRRWEHRVAARLAGRVSVVASVAGAMIPLLAAGAAKPLQIGIMRSDELTRGVVVRVAKDAEPLRDSATGEAVRSRTAGSWAVGTTVASRFLYLVPPMLLPPAIMAAAAPLLVGSPPLLRGALLTVTCAALSAVTTPICMALWEQIMALPVSTLEPHVQQAAQEAGIGQDATLVFNKGL